MKGPRGGVVTFERLVQSVKRCLKKILKNAKVTREELQTVLVEIEATLNSRPLTFEEPLTPYHFLGGRRYWLCQIKKKLKSAN